MENYLDIVNQYLKEKNNLLRFNSFSNDVRLYGKHVIKVFNSKERLEKSITGLQIMKNTNISVPTVQFIYTERRIIIENYIDGIVLNENTVILSKEMLFDIGRLMGKFHSINVSSQDDENSWIATILTDMKSIKVYLAPYEDEFKLSIDYVETECKRIFKNLHFTYVHGDFKPSNIIWNERRQKYYLIDFENFMIGDPTLDIYKMLSILKANEIYSFKEVETFLNGYTSICNLPDEFLEKWNFYDVYYSLRSIRRAIKEDHFRNSEDQYIHNADLSAQIKNPRTLVMSEWLKKYL